MRPLELMHIVSSTLNVPYVNYTNGSRLPAAMDLRTIAAMKMREICGVGVKEICSMYKLKNHTTIVKNCARGYSRLNKNKNPFSVNYVKCSMAIIVHANKDDMPF